MSAESPRSDMTRDDGVIDLVMNEIVAGHGSGTDEDRLTARHSVLALPENAVAEWFGSRLTEVADHDMVELVTAMLELAGRIVANQTLDLLDRLPDGDERSEMIAVLAGHPEILQVVRQRFTDNRADRRLDALKLALTFDQNHQDLLLEALADPNATVRRLAVEHAGALDSPLLHRHLATMTVHDASPDVRVEAVTALAGARETIRHEAALVAATSDDASVRLAAAAMLGGGGAEAVDRLMALLDDADIEVAGVAAEALVVHHRDDAPAALWPALVASAPSRRARFVQAVDRLDSKAFDLMVRRGLRSDAATERALALQLAAHRDRGEEIVSLLHEALTDPAIEVRLHAIDALAGHLEAIDVGRLGERVRDPAPAVRLEAVKLLRSTADDRSLDALLIAASDPTDHVRELAREALLDRRGPGLVADLLAAITDPARQRTVRDLLVDLDHLGLEPMLDLLESADERIRSEVGAVLRAGDHLDELQRRLVGRDPVGRDRALRGLSAAAVPDTVVAIADRLADPVPTVRRHAVEALEYLGDRRALPSLRQALVSDPDLDLVADIDRAIRSLSSPEDV